MSHEPLSTQNGRYISTKWALGGSLTLLVLAIGGWAGWLHSTVWGDHDTLIRATASLEALVKAWDKADARLGSMEATLRVIVDDHKGFRERLSTEGR